MIEKVTINFFSDKNEKRRKVRDGREFEFLNKLDNEEKEDVLNKSDDKYLEKYLKRFEEKNVRRKSKRTNSFHFFDENLEKKREDINELKWEKERAEKEKVKQIINKYIDSDDQEIESNKVEHKEEVNLELEWRMSLLFR